MTWYPFFYLEGPKPLQHSLFYDWNLYLKQFWLGREVNPGKEKGELLNQWIYEFMSTMFADQPLALPGSAKNIVSESRSWIVYQTNRILGDYVGFMC